MDRPMRRLSRRQCAMSAVAALAAALFVFSASCAAKSGPEAAGARLWVSDGRSDFAPAPVRESPPGKADFSVGSEFAAPPIEGFGGAFNEKGWEALKALPEPERERALKEIFEPGRGLSLSFCRVPIGSSDYALSRYSLDETAGDYPMSAFSIDRDRRDLLPYIAAARLIAPSLRFWASAWSPPGWMKDNGSSDGGSLKDDPRVYAAYALYLKKFAAAYRREGVAIEAIAVQNEPSVLRNYPSCGWTPRQYLVFVRDYLGPALEGSGSGVMLGTFNDPGDAAHAMAVLSDPKAAGYVKCLGLQWFGLPIAGPALARKPGLAVWHTETDCGNHYWEPGYSPDKAPNDFAYAAYTWDRMSEYVGGGATLYSLWNIVLDPAGLSIDSKRPWPQNAAVLADAPSGKAILTPMFYAFASFSRFLPRGSRLLRSSGGARALAFALPDGKKAVILMNPGPAARRVAVSVDGRSLAASLKPRSFGALIVEEKP